MTKTRQAGSSDGGGVLLDLPLCVCGCKQDVHDSVIKCVRFGGPHRLGVSGDDRTAKVHAEEGAFPPSLPPSRAAARSLARSLAPRLTAGVVVVVVIVVIRCWTCGRRRTTRRP